MPNTFTDSFNRSYRHMAKMLLRCLSVSLVWAAVAAPLMAQQDPKPAPLTESELHSLIDAGVLLDFEVPRLGVKGTVLLMRGGSAHMVWLTGTTSATDAGRWRIAGKLLCVQWEKLRNGQEQCAPRFSKGGNRYELRQPQTGNVLVSYLARRFPPPVTESDHAQSLAARYRVRSPGGKGPFPAAVLVSGCVGFEAGAARAHFDDVQERLTTEGFVSVRVDYLGSRNAQSCLAVPVDDIVRDIALTLADLRKNPRVDGNAINVIGWSWGGGSALHALASKDEAARIKVARVAAYYPACGIAEPWSSPVPVLLLHGSIDTIAPIANCERLMQRLPSTSHAELVPLAGAHHAFDVAGLPSVIQGANGTMGSNPRASELAWRRLIAFLAR